MSYEHVTDEGVTRQIFAQHCGRAPTEAEIARLRRRFVELLHDAVSTRPETCREVPGAADALTRLRREPDWRIAIATGCWHNSARLKLKAAAISVDDVPLATSEDALQRPGIVAHAISRALAHYGQERFDRVVSIGDGVWDVHTARHLDLPMLGVCHDGRVERLREHGVTHVIPDFSDFQHVLQALTDARIPKPRNDPMAR
jgi:phosphoglycolate phosphatase-like HAD superfamily hydrolase